MIVGQDQLQGWKEIAEYLRRDERTAKRWEKQRGLPVRRIPGAGRANVYCLVSELEQWLVSEQNRTAASSEPREEHLPQTTPPDLPSLVLTPTAPPPPPDQPTAAPAPRRRFWIPASIAAVATLSLLAFSLSLVAHQHLAPPVAGEGVLPRAATSASAQELFLQGQYLLEERTPGSLTKARQDFSAAIRLDGNFAAAYAGLANTFLLLREYSTMPSVEAYTRAREAAQHALALDPSLPEAHAALGFIDFFFSWEADKAEAEFQTALRLDARSVLARHWYGSMLLHQARYDEALIQLNFARSLSPASPAILASQALALGLSGHRNEASDLLQTLASNGHEAASLHRALATLSLVEPRDLPRYLQEVRQLARLRQDQNLLRVVAAGERSFRTGGEPALWSAMAREEHLLHPDSHPTYLMADLAAATGHDQEALHDLETLADQRDPEMIGIAMDPLLQALRQSGSLRTIALRMNTTQPNPAMLAHSLPAGPLFRLP